MNVEAGFHRPTSSPTSAALPTVPLPHTQPLTTDPPQALLDLPPRPPEHPHQATAAARARQQAMRAPLPRACLRRPPTRHAGPSPQVSHPLRSNAEATRRPGHRPELHIGGGGPLRTVDSTRRWLPPAGATTEARGRGYSWRHYHFSSRRPPARAPRSPPALCPLCYNYSCSALAVWGIAVA